MSERLQQDLAATFDEDSSFVTNGAVNNDNNNGTNNNTEASPPPFEQFSPLFCSSPSSESSVASVNAKKNNLVPAPLPRKLSPSGSATTLKTSRSSFKRVLYLKQQGYDDNFVDPKLFLQSMHSNKDFVPYNYWSCVTQCCVLHQEISLCSLFAICFYFLLFNVINSVFLFCFEGCFLALDLWLLYQSKGTPPVLQWIKNTTLISCVLLFLTPILKDLTHSFANDSIWSLVIITSVLHLLFFDYSFVNGYSSNLNDTLSMNSVFLTAVLYASRLNSFFHSFLMITLAIELFSMFSSFRRGIKSKSNDLHLDLTWILFCVTSALLFSISYLLGILFLFVSIFVVFVVPSWLIYVQRYKDAIEGPWDIGTDVNDPKKMSI